MTKVGHFGQPELTLGILGIQLMFTQLLQYKSKMFGMLFFALGIYKDIIKINHDEFVEVVHEDVILQS